MQDIFPEGFWIGLGPFVVKYQWALDWKNVQEGPNLLLLLGEGLTDKWQVLSTTRVIGRSTSAKNTFSLTLAFISTTLKIFDNCHWKKNRIQLKQILVKTSACWQSEDCKANDMGGLVQVGHMVFIQPNVISRLSRHPSTKAVQTLQWIIVTQSGSKDQR